MAAQRPDLVLVPDVTRIWVAGDPVTQGSKQGYPIYRGPKNRRVFTGKVALVEDNDAELRPWRRKVTEAGRLQYRGLGPMDGDLSVGMVFALRRPPSVTRSYPNVPGDLIKYVRAVEDSLTDAKVWVDDSRVVNYHRQAKVYAGGPYVDGLELPEPGVWIEITYIGEPPAIRRVARPQGQPDPYDVAMLAGLDEGELFSA